MRDAVICEPVRTAVGRYGGMFKDLSAHELGATVVRGLLARTNMPGNIVYIYFRYRRIVYKY